MPPAILRPRFQLVAPGVDIPLGKFKLGGVRDDSQRPVALGLRVNVDAFQGFQPVHAVGGVGNVFGDKQIDKQAVGFDAVRQQEGGGVHNGVNLRYLVAAKANVPYPLHPGEDCGDTRSDKPGVHALIEIEAVIRPRKLVELLYAVITGQYVVVHQNELVRVGPDDLPPVGIGPDVSFLAINLTPRTTIWTASCDVSESVITGGVKTRRFH